MFQHKCKDMRVNMEDEELKGGGPTWHVHKGEVKGGGPTWQLI